MQTRGSSVSPDGTFGNFLRNLGWLMGGKGFGAVCSLIYLAILSRSLGIKDFGHFALIFGTGQALVSIASFQTWQTLIKFGAEPLHSGDSGKFGRLVWLCGSIDVAGAMVGTVIAAVIYYGFAGILDLNPTFIDMAFAFNCALLWSRLTTPNGIVRVLNRFDLGTYVEAVVPLGRLLASLVILAVGATVGRFLFAWAVFDILAAVLYWIVAWRLAPKALNFSNFGTWGLALRENVGLRRFFGVTYAASTLDAAYKQGPLLAIGYLLGTSAAGVYRLADQLAQGIGKLSQLIARAVFPELARSRAGQNGDDFRKLVRKVALLTGSAGITVVLLALLVGETLLTIIGGEPFAAGATVLVPLAIGAAFELAAISFEPTLYSTGHARMALLARLCAAITLAAGVWLLAPLTGIMGVGWAVAMGLAVLYAMLSGSVWFILRRESRPEQG